LLSFWILCIDFLKYIHIELSKEPKTNHVRLLSLEEIKTLLQHYSTKTNLLHKAAFYLAIGCGLRKGEMRALTIDDIDFENGILTKEVATSIDATSLRNYLIRICPKFVHLFF
jgi:integrase